MRFLRRFLAVGSVATLIDVSLLLSLVLFVGWTPVIADITAVTAATIVSFVGHRRLSFAGSPGRRWYRNIGRYALSATTAGLVDVVVLWAVLGGSSDPEALTLVPAKAVSVGAALLIRIVFFRQAMFGAIRSDQQTPADRGDATGELRLSVVIPAYHEEDGIGPTLARVERALGALRHDGGFEVIVVDDGSGDATAKAASAAGADVVIRLPENRGKGAAVRAGVLEARGRCVAFTDADLSYAPEQILGLMEQIEAGWDVVVGSRRHTEARTLVAAGRLREIGGRVINLFTSIVLLGQYRDTQCGLKAFRSDVAHVVFERCQIDGFAFDVELFHLVERYRFTLTETPVEVVNSARSTVHVVPDAGRLIRDLFRIRAIGRAGGYEISVADLPDSLRPIS